MAGSGSGSAFVVDGEKQAYQRKNQDDPQEENCNSGPRKPSFSCPFSFSETYHCSCCRCVTHTKKLSEHPQQGHHESAQKKKKKRCLLDPKHSVWKQHKVSSSDCGFWMIGRGENCEERYQLERKRVKQNKMYSTKK